MEEVVARVESRRAAVAAMRAEVQGAEAPCARPRGSRSGCAASPRAVTSRSATWTRRRRRATTAASNLEATRRRLSQAEREVQQAEAELASRKHAVAQARERVLEARATLARAESQRHTVPLKEAEVLRAEARLRETQADLALAELQLSHTEVRAPVDGVIAKKTVELGQIVQMGQPLIAIVPLHDGVGGRQLQGDAARTGASGSAGLESRSIRFRASIFHGIVDSISAGTGSRFSLLPPENATGNWVKVVQRVPVKIRLDAKEVGNPQPLRTGMSAVVTIKVK